MLADAPRGEADSIIPKEFGDEKAPVLPLPARVIRFVGCYLICGSAVACVAMNQGARLQDTQFFYWQRYFVDGVVAIATLPGVWLFFCRILSLVAIQRTKKPLALAIMALLAVINSQRFIIPLSEQTSMPAFQAGQTGLVRRHLWLPKRGKPAGAVNGSWLPGCLAVYSLWQEGAKAH